MGYQLRAEFGTIEGLAGDQGAHAGNIEGFRAALKAQAAKALDNFAGGMGQDEHNACMAKVDQLVDEYVQNMQKFKSTTHNVHDTFMQGGQRARGILGGGA
jgi:uncharacterized protein YukE